MNFLKKELRQLRASHLRRKLRSHDDRPGRLIEINGKPVLNFSSNNYLGLAGHPDLARGSQAALAQGTGATASRLVTGNLAIHEALEASLAKLHDLPAARLFNSGYQANLGLISSVAGPKDLLVSDKLNHASMIDGSRLSKAQIRVAEHADPSSVAMHLENNPARRKFVLTDSVFSMDGDLAPLKELRTICDKHDAFLIVDEAHAVGVLGQGAGLCAELGVVPDALVGGLGKAFGGFGGYVAGSEDLAEFLLNRARSFVFSTALPPAVVGSSQAAVVLLEGEVGVRLRWQLFQRIEQLRDGLAGLGFLAAGAGHSPIFPIIIGDAAATVERTKFLLGRGVFCQCIRPPTVERGKSRLRVALSAEHTEQDVEKLLAALAELP